MALSVHSIVSADTVETFHRQHLQGDGDEGHTHGSVVLLRRLGPAAAAAFHSLLLLVAHFVLVCVRSCLSTSRCCVAILAGAVTSV